jgi:hypothetical protein
MNAIGSVKFCLGQIVATPAAIASMEASGQTPDFFVEQHVAGNWGIVDENDWQLNDQALKDGDRILSAYLTLKGTKLWIITEAKNDEGHRAATTILLPEDY